MISPAFCQNGHFCGSDIDPHTHTQRVSSFDPVCSKPAVKISIFDSKVLKLRAGCVLGGCRDSSCIEWNDVGYFSPRLKAFFENQEQKGFLFNKATMSSIRVGSIVTVDG